MNPKFLFVLLISFIITIPVFTQDADELNNKASAILLTLAQDKIFPENEFNNLKDLLVAGVNEDLLQTKFLTNISSFDSLKSHFAEYENENKGINTDSSLVLFADWYLHLQRTFYKYFKQNFLNASGTKILFFGTSVSCYCTKVMSRNQLIDILNLKKTRGNDFSFLVVDSYWNIDLQLKYEAYFAPSVLVLNSGNELLSLIEYEEKMPEKLSDILEKL